MSPDLFGSPSARWPKILGNLTSEFRNRLRYFPLQSDIPTKDCPLLLSKKPANLDILASTPTRLGSRPRLKYARGQQGASHLQTRQGPPPAGTAPAPAARRIPRFWPPGDADQGVGDGGARTGRHHTTGRKLLTLRRRNFWAFRLRGRIAIPRSGNHQSS